MSAADTPPADIRPNTPQAARVVEEESKLEDTSVVMEPTSRRTLVVRHAASDGRSVAEQNRADA